MTEVRREGTMKNIMPLVSRGYVPRRPALFLPITNR
jgi:hypothetical protein